MIDNNHFVCGGNSKQLYYCDIRVKEPINIENITNQIFTMRFN